MYRTLKGFTQKSTTECLPSERDANNPKVSKEKRKKRDEKRNFGEEERERRREWETEIEKEEEM